MRKVVSMLHLLVSEDIQTWSFKHNSQC